MTRILTCILGGVLALAAGPVLAQSGPSFPVNQLWQAETLNGENVRAAKVTLTVTRDAEGTRGAGYAGCNRWAANVTIGPQQLTFGPIMGTRRACAGPAMQIEEAFLKLLDAKPGWKMQGETLVLSGAGGEVHFARGK